LKIDLSYTADEAQLVQRCKNNEPAAQRALYDRHVEDIMILCLRYVTNTEDAKEAMMDSFLSFFKNIGGFEYRGEGSAKAWLRKIAVNHCLMRLRKNAPTYTELVEGTNEPAIEENEVFGSMAAKEILELLQSLPDGYRTVFNLYVFEDMGHKEIGEVLGISENTSKSQLHRARAMMKAKLEARDRQQ
jgi:RNA polymerase sigma factor (sigma-70 family)